MIQCRRILWILLAASLAAPQILAAQAVPSECTLNLQQLGETHVGGYNALRGGEYAEPIRLRLQNSGATDCAGTLVIRNVFDRAALEGANRETIAYVIADEHNRSASIFDPSVNASEEISVSVDAGKSIELQPWFVVPGGQAAKSGRYAASVEARFRQAGGIVDQVGTVELSVDVTPSVQANFVGYGRDATMNLGELEPGKTDSIGLQIRASTDVDVEVSSEERGNLRHLTGAAIPYSMIVDGTVVDLGAGDLLELGLADSIQGRTIPIDVVVGHFGAAPVGRYRDIVTFRISAR